MANANFGQPVPGNTYDPALMHGLGKRGYNWEFSTGIQHELLARTSVDVSYFRRTYGNFRVNDNRVLAAADFDKFDFAAPSDPRLPDGGGYTIHGMYNLNPAKFGLPSNTLVAAAEQLRQADGALARRGRERSPRATSRGCSCRAARARAAR